MVTLAGAIDDLDDQSLDFGDLRPTVDVADGDDGSDDAESDLYMDDAFEEETNEELKRTALEFANKLTELEMENDQLINKEPSVVDDDLKIESEN